MYLLSCCLIPYFYTYVVSNYTGDKRWKMQTMCKIILTSLTGEQFISIRPQWLRNPLTGKNIELDMYNERLSLACEYNGRQHYEYTPHFHKERYCAYDKKIVDGMRHFELQVYRDDLKKTLCDKNGVTLIIIPYTISPYDLVSYIHSKLSLVKKHREKHGSKEYR